MARIGSQAVAGYFKTPVELLPSLASLIAPGPGVRLFDPCAGDGEAVQALAAAWSDAHSSPRIYACEIEETRFRGLSHRLGDNANALIHGDALQLQWSADSKGADVLYLNPPYDYDAEHGRLELAFLRKLLPLLVADGALLAVLPVSALRYVADTVAGSFVDVGVWRFPDGHYEDFKQVVIRGRKAWAGEKAGAELIRAGAENPLALPVLPESSAAPLEVSSRGSLYDLRTAPLAKVLPMRFGAGLNMGLDLPATEIIGRRDDVALPIREAHAAMVLAAGHLNGCRLTADRAGFPDIVVKGIFGRRRVTVKHSHNKKGEITGATEAEIPHLALNVLRTDTWQFFQPSADVELTDAESLDDATVADVLTVYGASLRALIRRQFRPMHDPANNDHAFKLPSLPRTPFTIQATAIRAAVRLIARGQNPQMMAEVGTGKTTMALYTAAALSPGHHADTAHELARLGEDAPPVVRRSLVVCPPHLLKSWADQAAATWPGARVRVVNGISDLHAEADLYILSRETAKLGTRIDGVSRCPKCARPVDADKAAKKRLTCSGAVRRPANVWAKIARDLAGVALPAIPHDDAAQVLAGGRVMHMLAEKLKDNAAERNGALFVALESILARVVDAAEQAFENGEDDLGREAHPVAWHLAKSLRPVAPTFGPLTREKTASFTEPTSITWRGHLSEALRLLGPMSEFFSKPCRETLYTTTPRVGKTPARHGWKDYVDADRAAREGGQVSKGRPKSTRYPLATYISRRMRDRFDLVIVDEAHEYSNPGTAQSNAAARLLGLGCPTMILSGSFHSGYASSLFQNLYATSARFRESFNRNDRESFVKRYGLRKFKVDYKSNGSGSRGRYTDRREGERGTVSGEAPGFVPSLLPDHVLQSAIVVTKDDLDEQLPEITETLVPVHAESGTDVAMVKEGMRICHQLVMQIKRDHFTSMRGRLMGAMSEIPSYFDRCTVDHHDTEKMEFRYPKKAGGGLVTAGALIPEHVRTAKERWMIDEIAAQLERGRRVLIFVRHSRGALPGRLARMIKADVTRKVRILDAQKVNARKREEWIDKNVNEKGIEVLITNHATVKTGLNNLVGFSTAIHFELDLDARTFRQANGRLHRIGQTNEVEILVPYFAGTVQEHLANLISKKVAASTRFDAKSVAGALAVAGAGSDEDAAAEAMGAAEALYKVLSEDAA